jgi:hypothetical protein
MLARIMSIEAMKQALEALEKTHTAPGCEQWALERKACIALRTAIAEAEKQEPVAWVNKDDLGKFDMRVRTNCDYYHTMPLYTTPPAQRQWVGLTGEEREQIYQKHCPDALATAIAAVEDKLKDKNT